jgi:hypothetical protein
VRGHPHGPRPHDGRRQVGLDLGRDLR